MQMRKIIRFGLVGLAFGATYLSAQEPIVRLDGVWKRFQALLESPDGRAKADAFRERVKSIIDELDAAFPDRYARTKETLRSHLEQLRQDSPRP